MLVDPVGEEPITPTYREGHPAMTMTGMRNAWAEDIRERQWHNERLDLVALLEILEWRPSYAEVFCEWVGADGKLQGQRLIIDLLKRPTMTGRWKVDAFCPGCRAAVPTLYLVEGEWKCAGCHKLVPLASLMNDAEKFLERYRRLYREVNGREPPTRGFRTWDRKRIDLQMMEKRTLYGMITQMPPHLRARVAGEWTSDIRILDDPENLAAIGYRKPETHLPGITPWFG